MAYKLTYFNGRGRGEIIRLCLSYAGQEFEDKRIDGQAWGAIKDSTMPPYMPFLEVDGKKLGESCLVASYVAQKHGFGGDTDEDKHILASYTLYIESIFTKLAGAAFEKDEEKKKKLQAELQEKTIPDFLKRCEGLVSKNDAGVLHGSKVSQADIHFYNVVSVVKAQHSEVLSGTPGLAALYDRVANDPKISAWVAKRPDTPF